MRHDYQLPAEWPSMSDSERSEWFTAERCRRQALRQRTGFADSQEEARIRRDRRANARADTVSLNANR